MTLPIPLSNCFTTPRHEQLRVEVQRFAETVVAPKVAEMERSKRVEEKLPSLIAEQGWVGVTVPPQYAGMGLGHVAKLVIIETLAKTSGAMGAMVQASQLGVAKILHFGTEEQKCRWLPAVARGTCLPTIAVTEPGSGSHVLGMTATAERDGDDYILNGIKTFVGNSHVGDLHGVVVRTGPGSRGLSAFLVEADRPGLRLGEHSPALGLHGFSFGDLIFEDCRVPAANLLGAEGGGLDVAYSSSVLYGRPNLTGVSLGIHRALVEVTVHYAHSQRRYGRPLADVDTVKQRLGQMQANLMTAETVAYHAVHLLDQGLACDAELINAKLMNHQLAVETAQLAMEVHGAHGLMVHREVERLLRDAQHMYAPAGTSDVQRLRLSEVAAGDYQQDWSARMSAVLRDSGAVLRTA